MGLLELKSGVSDLAETYQYTDPDFFDLASASYESQSELGSLQGLAVMLRENYENAIRDTQGRHRSMLQEDATFSRSQVQDFLNEMLDEDPSVWRGSPEWLREDILNPVREFFGLDPIEEGLVGRAAEGLTDIQSFDKRLQELQNIDPNVKTFADVWQDTLQQAAEIQERTERVLSRGPGFSLGAFAGGMVGSFTDRDPLNLFTMGIGGGALQGTLNGVKLALGATKLGTKSAFTSRVIGEGLVQGGIETVNQFGGVQENRRLLGLPDMSPMEAIAMAAIGGGLIRGGIEGIGKGVRVLRGNKLDKAKAESGEYKVYDEPIGPVLARTETPQPRYGSQSLVMRTHDNIIEGRKQDLLNTVMPITQEGVAIEGAILKNMENMFNNEPIVPFPVARLTDSSIITAPIPIAHPLRDVVKQQEPKLFKELKSVEVKIQKLQTEIDKIKMPTDRDILIKHPEMKPSILKRLDAIDEELQSGKFEIEKLKTPRKTVLMISKKMDLQNERNAIINKFDEVKLKKTVNRTIKKNVNKKQKKQQELKKAKADYQQVANQIEQKTIDAITTKTLGEIYPDKLAAATQIYKDAKPSNIRTKSNYDLEAVPERQAATERASKLADDTVEQEIKAASEAIANKQDVVVDADGNTLPGNLKIGDETLEQIISRQDEEINFAKQIRDCAK